MNHFYNVLEASDADVMGKQKELFNPTVHTWAILQSIPYLEHDERCAIIKHFIFINHILDVKHFMKTQLYTTYNNFLYLNVHQILAAANYLVEIHSQSK